MGWDLRTAGNRLGVDRRTIQRWESGQWEIPFAEQEIMENYWNEFLEALGTFLETLEDQADDGSPIQLTLTDNPEDLAVMKALAIMLALEDYDVIAKHS